MASSTSRERYSFANLVEPLELPDLIAVQRESFDWFLNEGMAEAFADISPIKDFSEALQLELELDADDEDLRPPPSAPPPPPVAEPQRPPRAGPLAQWTAGRWVFTATGWVWLAGRFELR